MRQDNAAPIVARSHLAGGSVRPGTGLAGLPRARHRRSWLSVAFLLAVALFSLPVYAQSSTAPVNGACSSTNGTAVISTPTSLCSAGAASSLGGRGPWRWTCGGSDGGTTATCSAAILHLTFAALAPSLVATMGFDNPAYVPPSMPTSPVTAAPGDVSEQFFAPDARLVTVTVKSPVTTSTYVAAPMPPGESPVAYFQKAIAAAGSGSTLLVPMATYTFPALDCTNIGDPNYASAHLLIQSVHDMVIDGQGSTLNFVADCPGVVFNAAARISFKNFTVDWPDWPGAAVATVTAVGGTASRGYTYSLQVPASEIISSFAVVTAWDAVNNTWSLTRPHDEIYYSTNYHFSAAGSIANLPSYGLALSVGESLLVRNLTGQSSAVVVWNSQDITIQGVSIYDAPSTVADAVHFGAYGGDVIIEDSTFAYQGDDGINIHTATWPVAPMPGCATSTCLSPLPAGAQARTGDSIALFGPSMQFVRTTAAVCIAGTCSANIAPIAAQGGLAADLTLGNARTIVRSNTFYHNRARGVLLQTAYGLVQDNSFIGQSLFALYLVESAAWQEGPGAQNVLVAGNVIASPGIGGGRGAITVGVENSNGLIYVSGTASGVTPPIPGVHQNLVFYGNTVEDVPGAAVYLSSANDVLLYGNTLGATNTSPATGTPNAQAPIVIYDASNVTMLDNTLNGGSLSGSVLVDDSDAGIIGK
jgi:hypothetical protein